MANGRSGFGATMAKAAIPIVSAGVVGYLVRDLDLKTLMILTLMFGVWAGTTAALK